MVINYFSSLAFGIYLIHDYWRIRGYLWNDIANVPSFELTRWLLPVSIGLILAVLYVGGIIESIRQHTVDKLRMKVTKICPEKLIGGSRGFCHCYGAEFFF